MKKVVFLLGISLCFLASAQEKKKDSIDFNSEFLNYKARIFYPVDCSCPGKVIYKEAKPSDKNFNPYNYKEIKIIKIEDFNEEEKKTILDFIKKA